MRMTDDDDGDDRQYEKLRYKQEDKQHELEARSV